MKEIDGNVFSILMKRRARSKLESRKKRVGGGSGEGDGSNRTAEMKSPSPRSSVDPPTCSLLAAMRAGQRKEREKGTKGKSNTRKAKVQNYREGQNIEGTPRPSAEKNETRKEQSIAAAAAEINVAKKTSKKYVLCDITQFIRLSIYLHVSTLLRSLTTRFLPIISEKNEK